MPPKYSPATQEFRVLSGAVKGGRARMALADKISTLKAEQVLDVSNYSTEGDARKIKSPKAGLTRVNSKGNEVIVPRSKFGNDKVVSNNAASYAAAMHEVYGGARSQYEREWNDMYRGYVSAADASKAATAARKASRPKTARPPTGKPRGRPRKNPLPVAGVRVASPARMQAVAALEQAEVAAVERDLSQGLSRALSASASQHSRSALSMSPRVGSRSPMAVPVVQSSSRVASPRSMARSMSPSRMLAAGIPQ